MGYVLWNFDYAHLLFIMDYNGQRGYQLHEEIRVDNLMVSDITQNPQFDEWF